MAYNTDFDFEYQLDLIKRLEAHKSEVEEQIEALKDGVKAEMSARGLEQVKAGEHSVSWKPYTTHKFDTKQFKTDHENLYNLYNKTLEIKRFIVK